MRRGGSSYFVFDVSERLAPKLEFSINAGDAGLERMGQSWSRPTLTQVQIGGSIKDVMIVGGGYDESQDDKSIRSEDSVGNAVYMFDANTGDLLWSAGNDGNDLVLNDMKYSIPGRVSVIDRNSDGLADHMYVERRECFSIG
jgi:type IV pilus assembly protein PilY1